MLWRGTGAGRMPYIAGRLEQLIGMAGGLPEAERRTLVDALAKLQAENPESFTAQERERLAGVIGRITTLDEGARAGAETEKADREKHLVALLRAGARKEFVVAFAEATRLATEAASRVLADDCGPALAVLCKAAGFERSTYSAIVLLSDPLHARNPRKTHELLRLYDGETQKVA